MRLTLQLSTGFRASGLSGFVIMYVPRMHADAAYMEDVMCLIVLLTATQIQETAI